ncbi:Transcription initiation factor TFIID subunit 5 [Geodia barretti]|nr:Transcription initiation factor TFIID subunit 5 [Geodia barretti]
MDRLAFILDLSKADEDMVIQKFESHTKYVVRVLWSSSGNFFITASYDKTICVYKLRNDEVELYDIIQKLHFKGVIESLAFCKCRQMNMNSIGDDYVSFVPMHISFGPNGHFMLISTDQDRLLLYSWTNGKQIACFYGATNDELSQPRNCWDHSGKYVYGTSQDGSIVVWEIRSQRIVCKLEGHNATVRDLFFCNELKLLVSCGFDGSIKLWQSHSPTREIL